MNSATRPSVRIDFVSDVVCPWCAVGLAGLERAIEALRDRVDVELRFQPFELNPDMAPGGVDAAEYLKAKYGIDDKQLRINRERIFERGASVGFTFGERRRVWNSFDAHRLLAWALETAGPKAQWRLKRRLLQAYHGEGLDPSDMNVLVDAARVAGLDEDAARKLLASTDYASTVRDAEAQWSSRGISGVPAVIVNDQYLISGGQPPDVYERTLLQIATLREEDPTAIRNS